MLKCVAVDDEPLALDLLVDNIQSVPFLELEGSCRNALEALEVIQSKKPDLVFLDIQMPGLSGIQLAEHLRGKAMVIFLTAYESHALKGFDVNAIDYLLKPVTQERFTNACMKALELYTLRKPREDGASENQTTIQSPVNTPKFLFVYVDYNLVRIDINDIRFIEGYKDYVKIHLLSSKRPIITRMSMKLLEDKLLAFSFLRIHKSFIVSVGKVTSVQKSMLTIDPDELPVSESYRDVLMELIRKQNIL